jgi:hypothetical protein
MSTERHEKRRYPSRPRSSQHFVKAKFRAANLCWAEIVRSICTVNFSSASSVYESVGSSGIGESFRVPPSGRQGSLVTTWDVPRLAPPANLNRSSRSTQNVLVAAAPQPKRRCSIRETLVFALIHRTEPAVCEFRSLQTLQIQENGYACVWKHLSYTTEPTWFWVLLLSFVVELQAPTASFHPPPRRHFLNSAFIRTETSQVATPHQTSPT